MNEIASKYQSERKNHHRRILLVHILAVATYFFIIYYLNYESLDVDKEKIKNEPWCFRILISGWISLKSTINSIFITFKSNYYNHILQNIFINNVLYTFSFIQAHIIIFRLMPKWYIENEIYYYSLYNLYFVFYDKKLISFFNFMVTFFLGFIIHVIGTQNIDLYTAMISEYSNVFLINVIFFLILIIGSFSYVGLAVYLYVFKTSNCDIAIIHILLTLILLWIVDWTIAFVEVYTTSVTMFYFINRHSDSKIDNVLEVFKNIYFCLGSISIGKFYFYLQNTYHFVSEVISTEGFKLVSILKLLIGLPLALLSDFIAFWFDSFREYVLPYVAIYNVSYTKAVQKAYYLLYGQSLIRLFNNVFIKNIFLLIYLLIFPYFKYVKNSSPLVDNPVENIECFKIIFFTFTMTYYLWNIFFSIIYTINTTINFAIVLFPTILPTQ
jgi:hypothetical protein